MEIASLSVSKNPPVAAEWQLRRRCLWEAHRRQQPDGTGAHGVYAAGLPHWTWRWTGRRTYPWGSWLYDAVRKQLCPSNMVQLTSQNHDFSSHISPWSLCLTKSFQPKRNIAGETVFYAGHGTKEVLRVVPNTGMALVHRHGRECLLHESLPVRSGVKQLGAKGMG